MTVVLGVSGPSTWAGTGSTFLTCKLPLLEFSLAELKLALGQLIHDPILYHLLQFIQVAFEEMACAFDD